MVTVTRIAGKRTRNQYGDPATQAAIPDLEIPGCEVAPRVGAPGTGSNEIHKHGRDGITEGKTLYAPLGADITHVDKIRYLGHVYEVEGVPQVWGDAGIEVGLRRTAG